MIESLNLYETVLAAAIATSTVSLILSLIFIIKYRSLYRKYDRFLRGRNAESLESLILQHQKDIAYLMDKADNTEETFKLIKKNLSCAYQKAGLVHYDAFNGMGGKISFALTLLDGTNTGVVINCMHGADGCYVYIKEIDEGATSIPLGIEEKESLERALGYIVD